jgi:hypothetical protein
MSRLGLENARKGYVVSVVGSVVLMVSLTLLDVLVVHFLLWRNGLLFGLPFHWWFPFWVMEFCFPLCLIMMLENKVPLICYLFFTLGGEDTLYYLFAVGRVPEVYQGIYFLGFIFAPRREIVLAMLGLSIFLSVLICYLDFQRIRGKLKLNRFFGVLF